VNGGDKISIAKTPLSTPSEYSLKEIQRRLLLKVARILSEDNFTNTDEARETAMRRLSYTVVSPPKPLERLLNAFFMRELNKLAVEQYIAWGKIVQEARRKIINGKNRTEVLSELGDKVLPQTRGGPSIFTHKQLEGLRFAYDEMQLCIRDIRQRLNLPLKKIDLPEDEYNQDSFVGEDPIRYAKDGIPEITEIFDEKEIPIALSNKRISDISAEILVTRLNMCIDSNITSPRTLQNILRSYTLTLAE
jgi:hypothetical protein